MARKSKVKKVVVKKPTPYRVHRFGIQNHVGGVWTPETFSSEPAAQHYLDNARNRGGFGPLPKHKVVRVRVTVSLLHPKWLCTPTTCCPKTPVPAQKGGTRE